MPLGFTFDSPLSLYSIPVVWFVGFYPHTLKFILINQTVGYNNVQPRGNLDTFIQNKGISPRLAAKAGRMEGAHLNGMETYPLWAAALAGHIAKLDHQLMNKFTLAYIGMRLYFNYLYITNDSSGKSWYRTFIFFTGIALPCILLIKAANKLAC
ncbi:hypothetical protein BDQ17DRAFT_1299799 [Cyathus striatus]|nr:hypothetical protein BDQ17DRAFT_1299799 [Cyathus striatus]